MIDLETLVHRFDIPVIVRDAVPFPALALAVLLGSIATQILDPCQTTCAIEMTELVRLGEPAGEG